MNTQNEIGRFLGAKFATCIQRIDYPMHNGKPNPAHGKFFIVGSIPAACYDAEQGKSKIFDTESQAISAIVQSGVRRFQKSNCAWLDAPTCGDCAHFRNDRCEVNDMEAKSNLLRCGGDDFEM